MTPADIKQAAAKFLVGVSVWLLIGGFFYMFGKEAGLWR